MPFLQNPRLPLFLFPLLLGGVFLLYLQGLSGAMYYDDIALEPLKTLVWGNWGEILPFVGLGDTGPLGRPISLISFLLNMGDLPLHSDRILLFNVILHLLNGGLVFLLAFQLSALSQPEEKSTLAWTALGAAALWLIFPLQVSTNLIAVQRMASLSAFFVFAGLVVYLHGLARQIDKNQGFFLQIVGIVLFTVLAVLSKENGALLPIFALVLEITLLNKTAPRWKRLRVLLLSSVLCVLLVYMATGVLKGGFFNTLPGRDFSIAERLMTESLILFDYLRQAFFPSTFSIHPFHNYPIIHSLFETPKAGFAILAWLALLVSAIAWRKRFVVFSFAVLWFLTAHLLESTAFSLELYFGHRNYVALFGPALGLVFLLKKVPLPKRRIAIGGFIAYLLLLASILYSTTTLWGNQALAAQVWFDQREHGAFRAGANLSKQLENQGDLEGMVRVLKQMESDCPLCFPTQVMLSSIFCAEGDKEKTAIALSKITALAANPKRRESFLQDVLSFPERITSGQCALVSYDQIIKINRLLMENKSRPLTLLAIQAIHFANYRIAIAQNKKEKALSELLLAWKSLRDDTMGVAIIGELLDAGKIEEAKDFFVKEMCVDLPWHPLKAAKKEALCTEAGDAIGFAIEAKENPAADGAKSDRAP